MTVLRIATHLALAGLVASAALPSAAHAQGVADLEIDVLNETYDPPNQGFDLLTARLRVTSNQAQAGVYYLPHAFVSCEDLEGLLARGYSYADWAWLVYPTDMSNDPVDFVEVASIYAGDEHSYLGYDGVFPEADFVANMDRTRYWRNRSQAVHDHFQPLLRPGSGNQETYWTAFYHRWGNQESHNGTWDHWQNFVWGDVDGDGGGGSLDPQLFSTMAWVRHALVEQKLAYDGQPLADDWFETDLFQDLFDEGIVMNLQLHGIRGRDYVLSQSSFPSSDPPGQSMPGTRSSTDHQKVSSRRRNQPIIIPTSGNPPRILPASPMPLSQIPDVPTGSAYQFLYPYAGGQGAEAKVRYADGSSEWLPVRYIGYRGPNQPLKHGDACRISIPAGAPSGLATIKILRTMNGSLEFDLGALGLTWYTFQVQ